MPKYHDLKALIVLKANLRELLRERRDSDSLLAVHLGFKHRSSITKWLNDDRKGIEIERLEKLPSFFGYELYQLFQPGLSLGTERRSGHDRRTSRDRRVGQARRVMLETRAAIDASGGGRESAPLFSAPDHATVTKLRSALRDAEALVERLQRTHVPRSATGTRAAKPKAGEGDQVHRRARTGKAGPP